MDDMKGISYGRTTVYDGGWAISPETQEYHINKQKELEFKNIINPIPEESLMKVRQLI